MFHRNSKGKKVLVLIDWENVKICLQRRFSASVLQVQIGDRIKKALDWVRGEIGEISSGRGYVFAPEHFMQPEQDLCSGLGLQLIICPKRHLQTPAMNPKTREMETEQDTVDETLSDFGMYNLRHPDVGFICLFSGDSDYKPLFKEARSQRVKIAWVIPTLSSISVNGGLLRYVSQNPLTREPMFFRLDTLTP